MTDAATDDTATDDAATDDAATDDAAPEDAAPEDAVLEDAVLEDAVLEDAVLEYTVSEAASDDLLTAISEVFIDAPIDAVWAEVTKTHEVQKPMFDMRMDCDLEVGAPLRMRSANGKYTGVVGEVLAFEPPSRFSFTFRFTNFDDPPCRVTYELRPEGDGTHFRMVSDRLPPHTKSTKQMTQGGSMIVETLKAVMETGKPPLKTRLLYVMFALMAPFTPARCKSEHWP